MTSPARSAALAALGSGLAAALGLRLLRAPAPPPEPPPPYSLADGRVRFAAGSKLLGRLEVVAVGRAAQQSAEFRAVGQVIALSNASGNLTGDRVGWVELDPRLSAALGLSLADGGSERPGVAYGLTTLSDEFAGRVGLGQPVEVRRYGLRKAGVMGTVAKVVDRGEPGSRDIVFRFGQAQDWFPGTNCEVVFPVLRGRPVSIPTTAPVHEGSREFVWKQTGPGEFAPEHVSLVEATPDDASVLGLEPGDHVVARGAILLKPLLKPLLRGKDQD